MKDQIINTLKTIFDPEIPVNIYDLGLIYEINISETNDVEIIMTLSAPNCPVADDLVSEVQDKISSINQSGKTTVKITFDPPWDKSNMSDEALLELGFL